MELAVFLFIIGVVLVLLEVIIPSFGLLTLTALGTFALSVWRAYGASGATAAWVMGIIAPVLTLAILYTGLKYVPRTSWGRGLVLRHAAEDGPQLPPSASATLAPQSGTVEDALAAFVGREGIAQSELRPAGIVVVDGRRLDCVTEGALLPADTRVRVVKVEGNRVVVRPVKV